MAIAERPTPVANSVGMPLLVVLVAFVGVAAWRIGGLEGQLTDAAEHHRRAHAGCIPLTRAYRINFDGPEPVVTLERP